MALNAFEQEREARIARNRQRIQELELNEAAAEFKACAQRRQPTKVARAPRQLAPRPVLEKRRSGRLANQDPIQYAENVIDKADNTRTLRQFCASAEEVYTEEHIKLLGDYKEEWVLFQDGYDEAGNRIYDKSSGLTCHQCRQKTLGLRTSCSSCQSLKGVFCGDCLFMRYGENVKEAAQNPNWTCPDCRGICNCSIHRIRKGWAPTGSLFRRAIADGYKSVAHMLILTNQGKPADKPGTGAALPAVLEEGMGGLEISHPQPVTNQPQDQADADKTAPLKEAEDTRVAQGSKPKRAGKTRASKVPAKTGALEKATEQAEAPNVTKEQVKTALTKGVEIAAKKAKTARKAREPTVGRITRSRAIQACA